MKGLRARTARVMLQEGFGVEDIAVAILEGRGMKPALIRAHSKTEATLVRRYVRSLRRRGWLDAVHAPQRGKRHA